MSPSAYVEFRRQMTTEHDASPNSRKPHADVAIPVPSLAHGKSVYTYSIPGELASRLMVGHVVWIPLRRRVELGLVVRLHDEETGISLKPISAIVEPEFRLSPQQMELTQWLAHETVSTLFAAASPFFPPGVQHRTVEYYELTDADSSHHDDLTATQQAIVRALHGNGRSTISALDKVVDRGLEPALKKLEESGVVARSVEVVDKPPRGKTELYVQLSNFDPDVVSRAPKQLELLEILAQREQLVGRSGSDLMRARDLLAIGEANRSALTALAEKGLVNLLELSPGEGEERVFAAPAPVLSEDQARAWNVVADSLQSSDMRPILLHGVTGSGKTEIYLRAVGSCLRNGKGAIVLVPEIALATQIVQRFQDRFPGKVAVMHSELTDAERFATWKSIGDGASRVVVGPRSALFAPVSNLGLIVLDEEQDPSYKNGSDPRYHSRMLAEQMARQANATLVLGSATPAVETMHRVEKGEVTEVRLPERVGSAFGGVDTVQNRNGQQLPSVSVVDMREEIRTTGATLISIPLQLLLQDTFRQQKQSIVLLNRRGTFTAVICRSCGESVNCPQCDIPFVYHQDRDRLICHRCNRRRVRPRSCEACGGVLDYFGAGTQRIEQEVKRYLRDARIIRVDRDSVRRLGGYARILKRIASGEADIVVGTQIVAKGLDFPNVAAVGVIQADSALHLPDFRSAERTFQMITQVSGRAGRRASRGQVLVQAYTPDHYAIQSAADHDYDAFFWHEIAFRRNYWYPPFSRLIRYVYRHRDEAAAMQEAEAMAGLLIDTMKGISVSGDLLGPTPAFVARFRGDYQWEVVVRSHPDHYDALLDALPLRSGWTVTADPVSLL